MLPFKKFWIFIRSVNHGNFSLNSSYRLDPEVLFYPPLVETRWLCRLVTCSQAWGPWVPHGTLAMDGHLLHPIILWFHSECILWSYFQAAPGQWCHEHFDYNSSWHVLLREETQENVSLNPGAAYDSSVPSGSASRLKMVPDLARCSGEEEKTRQDSIGWSCVTEKGTGSEEIKLEIV